MEFVLSILVLSILVFSLVVGNGCHAVLWLSLPTEITMTNKTSRATRAFLLLLLPPLLRKVIGGKQRVKKAIEVFRTKKS